MTTLTPSTPATRIADSAARLWATFTPNERAMTRIGMFPADKMEAAELGLWDIPDYMRLLAVALMQQHDV